MLNRTLSQSGSSHPLSTISVIVCAYTETRWDELLEAVASLKTQTLQPDEIIVVIDHNDTLYQHADQVINGITLLSNQYEKGLSGARNTGIAAAAGELIVFMDEDAFADDEWIERIMQHFDDPTIVGVGGAIIPVWLQGKPSWFPEEFSWVVGCTYKGMPEKTAAVRNLIGCNMAYRRTVFEQVGLFRTGIGRVDTVPVGCEETELCIRIHQSVPHSRLLYDPDIIVHHRVPATRANKRYFRSRCYAEGLSKALIGQFVGSDAGLSSERSYVARTLPRGVFRGIGDALRGDLSGFGRAAAIIAGLCMTAAGYVRGRVRFALKPLTLDAPVQLASQPIPPHQQQNK